MENQSAAFYAAYDKLVADATTLGIQLVPVLVTGFSDKAELDLAIADYPSGSGLSVMHSIPFLETLKKGGQTFDCISNPPPVKTALKCASLPLIL